MNEALEPTDPVMVVDDEVAGVQVPVGLVTPLSPSLATRPMRTASPGNLPLPDDGDLDGREDETEMDTDGQDGRRDRSQLIDDDESCSGFRKESGNALRG
jgi:hypothetical protein